MEIKSLANIGFDVIFAGFDKAFAEYEMQLDQTQLWTMLRRRGFIPELSFAAFEGGDIVAFTLNGVGGFNGITTAYDTGTGTLKEYRGQGLATQVFEYSIPYLKDAGVGQYLLEVLQHNTKAVSVYRNLGFETVREFNYFRRKNEEIRNPISPDSISCVVKEIDINLFDMLADFWDFYPSWQNSFESIQRAAGDFVSLGAFVDGELVGYAVFEPASGDVTQLAVQKQHRRMGVGSLLFKEMLSLNENDTVKVINTDIYCESVTGFLEAKNIEVTGKQFEMIKKI